MVSSIRFKPDGIMVVRRRIHRFSSLSRKCLDDKLSGGEVIKLVIVMLKSLVIEFKSVVHLFRCLATVVSRSCVMSLKCPWNRVSKRFLVWPTYCMPHVLHVIT